MSDRTLATTRSDHPVVKNFLNMGQNVIFFKISRDTKNRAEIRDCPGKNGTSDHPNLRAVLTCTISETRSTHTKKLVKQRLISEVIFCANTVKTHKVYI